MQYDPSLTDTASRLEVARSTDRFIVGREGHVESVVGRIATTFSHGTEGYLGWHATNIPLNDCV
jgi:hypothetical protein